MIVELHPNDLARALNVGATRHVESIRAKLQDNHGLKRGAGWVYHMQGALGEMAFSKASGIKWNGDMWTFKKPDVGQYQVRFSPTIGNGLILRKGDNPENIYFLVTPVENSDVEFNVVGSILGKEGMVDGFKSKPDPYRPECWVVPQDKLAKPRFQ